MYLSVSVPTKTIKLNKLTKLLNIHIKDYIYLDVLNQFLQSPHAVIHSEQSMLGRGGFRVLT